MYEMDYFPRLVSQKWDGETPPTRIELVWSFLQLRLREMKEGLQQTKDEMYGQLDQSTFLKTMYLQLKNILQRHPQETGWKISNLDELQRLIRLQMDVEHKSTIFPSRDESAIGKPHDISVLRFAAQKLAALKDHFSESILRHLSEYCSNYKELGNNDDGYYRSLSSRNLSMWDILHNFDVLMSILKGESSQFTPPLESFCDSGLSETVSISVDCYVFPVLRIIPDLFQKLETVCDLAYNWLRGDKVYVEHLRDAIHKLKAKLLEMEHNNEKANMEYDELYSETAEKRKSMEEVDESYMDICNRKKKLEAAKSSIDMEIAAVMKNLKRTRENICSASSANRRFEHFTDSGKLLTRRSSREDNCCLSATFSSYMSRLCDSATKQETQLTYLQKRRTILENKVDNEKTKLLFLENTENKLQDLRQKLRSVGKYKARCKESEHVMRSRLRKLENHLSSRIKQTEKNKNEKKRFTEGRRSQVGEEREHHSDNQINRGIDKSNRSKALHEAFQIVSKNIGHQWKNLIRALPYYTRRDVVTINSEIQSIIHDHPFQLEEQCVQALVRWYKYCGENVSLLDLCSALRSIDQNWIADSIEKLV